MMKKAFLLPLLCLGMLSSCGTTPKEEGLQITCTVFPLYDWVSNVVGQRNDVHVRLLLQNGGDMHSYSPSVQDMARIASSDLFIYVGGESDFWVPAALANSKAGQKTINLLETLGEHAREEEHKEGMEGEEEEEAVYDEHIWLSLQNASICLKEITKSIKSLDASHAREYDANAATYEARLSALDASYITMKQNAARNVALFADRFPFLYLFKDYDIDYFAAFAGCSSESEASVKTIAFLAQKVDEFNLTSILKIEGSDDRLAITVRDASRDKNQKILTLDSMQSVRLQDEKHYLDVMESNRLVLQEALS